MLGRFCLKGGDISCHWQWQCSMLNCKVILALFSSYLVVLSKPCTGWVFLTGSAPKSVEDGKIPTKKWKWTYPTTRYEVLTLTFTFLVGILLSSTLRTFGGGTSKKTPCRCDVALWIWWPFNASFRRCQLFTPSLFKSQFSHSVTWD